MAHVVTDALESDGIRVALSSSLLLPRWSAGATLRRVRRRPVAGGGAVEVRINIRTQAIDNTLRSTVSDEVIQEIAAIEALLHDDSWERVQVRKVDLVALFQVSKRMRPILLALLVESVNNVKFLRVWNNVAHYHAHFDDMRTPCSPFRKSHTADTELSVMPAIRLRLWQRVPEQLRELTITAERCTDEDGASMAQLLQLRWPALQRNTLDVERFLVGHATHHRAGDALQSLLVGAAQLEHFLTHIMLSTGEELEPTWTETAIPQPRSCNIELDVLLDEQVGVFAERFEHVEALHISQKAEHFGLARHPNIVKNLRKTRGDMSVINDSLNDGVPLRHIACQAWMLSDPPLWREAAPSVTCLERNRVAVAMTEAVDTLALAPSSSELGEHEGSKQREQGGDEETTRSRSQHRLQRQPASFRPLFHRRTGAWEDMHDLTTAFTLCDHLGDDGPRLKFV
ncbi:hypothetical protein OC834_004511 [Tilletia horrida]|nr:hypothetical protein OC834_004511 [Tilletia horrida]